MMLQMQVGGVRAEQNGRKGCQHCKILHIDRHQAWLYRQGRTSTAVPRCNGECPPHSQAANGARNFASRRNPDVSCFSPLSKWQASSYLPADRGTPGCFRDGETCPCTVHASQDQRGQLSQLSQPT